VRVADEDGQALPDGSDGILRLRGPNVGPGYTDARNDAGVFTGDGWLITGDIGHRDANGYLHVTGRSKDVIIRSSHNIDPVVIEDALLRHPEVLMAAAVGAPDEYAGEMPVAFVSLRPGSQLEASELAEFAQRYIPERPAYPKTIYVLDALPMTAIGKLFKPALRVIAAQSVLQDRLARHGLSADVGVKVLLEGKEQIVCFIATNALSDDTLAPRLQEMMKGFGMKYRIEVGDQAGAGVQP
jgi:fatty-acyl-CoA synthase